MPDKRGQRRLRPAGRPSFLGDGLLERARATSLALLGATAAVGLAIVALAANQGWPLIAGSPIPQVPPRHQDVVGAKIAGRAVTAPPSSLAAGRRLRSPGRSPGSRRAARSGSPQAGAVSAPTASTELVVSPSTPAKSQSGESQGAPRPPAHHPGSPSKRPRPSPAAQTVSPAPPPATAAAPPPAPTPPVSTPPVATVSEAPPAESSVPAWSHGNGHAYGRSEDSGGETAGASDEPHGHSGDREARD